MFGEGTNSIRDREYWKMYQFNESCLEKVLILKDNQNMGICINVEKREDDEKRYELIKVSGSFV